jgi:predicted GNAT superfamily acetyltransferase
MREASAVDLQALLDLNNQHATETSLLNPSGFQKLIDLAYVATFAPGAKGFLIALDQDSGHSSINFGWFCERYERFAYVDRIVVAAHARGEGLARRLYEDLFAKARAAGHRMVGCEVNKVPPNPGSDAFHERMGFTVVGSATSEETGKTVRYMRKSL